MDGKVFVKKENFADSRTADVEHIFHVDDCLFGFLGKHGGKGVLQFKALMIHG